MKTIRFLLLALLLTSATTGCQNCMARLRGARCRPTMRMPTFRAPQPEAPCNTCNTSTQAVYAQPGVGVPMDSTGGYEVDPNWTVTETQRPVVTSVPSTPSEGVIVVPGPESGPLPAN